MSTIGNSPSLIMQAIHQSVPTLAVSSIVFEGEGDFCRAYTINEGWIFRFAYNAEGSRALEREAALLPRLVTAVDLAIPVIEYFGRYGEDKLAFVGYRKIEGVELTHERYAALSREEQERCARDLGRFLYQLHSFSIEAARKAGIIECGYPFCRTEDGIAEGPAEVLYRQDLEKLSQYPIVSKEIRQRCSDLLERHLHDKARNQIAPVVVHGDLSQDHVMFDPVQRRIVGVIDFSDVVITDHMLDPMYLLASYGTSFLEQLLDHYDSSYKEQMLARAGFLRQWHVLLRLLWALEHNYEEGISSRLKHLRDVMATG